MKVARFFAVLFAAAGLMLALTTVGFCLYSLDKPAKILEYPQAASDCTEKLMASLAQGDYAGAGSCLYGQPDLGSGEMPEDPRAALFWQTFLDGISYSFEGDCYARNGGFARQVTVTTPDLTALTADFQTRCQELLSQRIEAATEMSELYDEQNNFRQDLIDQVLEQAAQEAADQADQTKTYEITLELTFWDDRWWVLPNQELLRAMSADLT